MCGGERDILILLVQKQLISIRYLILIFIVVISVLTKGFLSTTLFNKLVCFRFFFVMDDKTYIRLVKIGYRNYSVSPRWYSTPLRVVEYHRLDWIILDIRFYLVEYLFNICLLFISLDRKSYFWSYSWYSGGKIFRKKRVFVDFSQFSAIFSRFYYQCDRLVCL